MVATITLKNVPDALHAQLLEQARRNKRSLNQEAIRSLEAGLFPRPKEVDVFLEEVRRSRTQVRTAGVPLLDDAFLSRALAEGRA